MLLISLETDSSPRLLRFGEWGYDGEKKKEQEEEMKEKEQVEKEEI